MWDTSDLTSVEDRSGPRAQADRHPGRPRTLVESCLGRVPLPLCTVEPGCLHLGCFAHHCSSGDSPVPPVLSEVPSHLSSGVGMGPWLARPRALRAGKKAAQRARPPASLHAAAAGLPPKGPSMPDIVFGQLVEVVRHCCSVPLP